MWSSSKSSDDQNTSSSYVGGLSTALWQFGRNAALGAAEYVTPVLTESQYLEKGVLTPEEFVQTGDMLVLRCPTWQWQAGDPAKARPFLPPDKQFLITRNVPCQRRARALGAGADDESLVAGGDDDGDEWVATHMSHTVQAEDETPDMMPSLAESVGGMSLSSGAAEGAAGGSAEAAASADAEALLEEEFVEADDPSAMAGPGSSDNIVRTRTYDVSITYDKYYQCARVWLYGYSETRQPLSQPEVLEDISADHALKTVTLESHPHISHGAGLHASLHPCKHASVMHKLTSEQIASGKECRPDQYLVLFLKFISSVIPTIEYDYTFSAN